MFNYYKINDYSVELTGYNDKKKDITIPYMINSCIVLGTDIECFVNNKLTSVKGLERLKYIGEYGFANNDIESIEILNNLTSISTGCFMNNKIRDIKIGSKILDIGDSAFENNKIDKLVIPDSVEYIGVNAFLNNNLKCVILPNKFKNDLDCLLIFGFDYDKLVEINKNFVKKYLLKKEKEYCRKMYKYSSNELINKNVVNYMFSDSIDNDNLLKIIMEE